MRRVAADPQLPEAQPADQVIRTIIKRSRRDPGAASIAPLAPGLLDLEDAARFMAVSKSTVERFCREGMPFLDLGVHHERCRAKRLLRFVPEQILEWAKERGRNGNDAT